MFMKRVNKLPEMLMEVEGGESEVWPFQHLFALATQNSEQQVRNMVQQSDRIYRGFAKWTNSISLDTGITSRIHKKAYFFTAICGV